MPTCIVLIGLPGTGKSTITKKMIEYDSDSFVYSTDAYIEEQARALGSTYDDLFTDYIKKAEFRMDAMLDIAVQDKLTVFWDQTNLSAKKRKKIIDRMKKAGYQMQAVAIIPPTAPEDIAEWEQRLTGRPGKTIPDFIMKNMKESYVLPTLEEGFYRVEFYNMYGKFVKALG